VYNDRPPTATYGKLHQQLRPQEALARRGARIGGGSHCRGTHRADGRHCRSDQGKHEGDVAELSRVANGRAVGGMTSVEADGARDEGEHLLNIFIRRTS